VEKLTAVMASRIAFSKANPIEPLDTDARLVARFLQGEPDAFEALFRKYQSYAFNISLGLLGNSDDAADVTQEAFLRVHRGMAHFRGDASFSTWLYRVVVNLCITELRRRQRSRLQFLEELQAEGSGSLEREPEEAPEAALELDEERQLVQKVLATLPQEYRAVLVLRHFQQLAYNEIAEVLNVSLSQVKTHLHRARKMFKDRYRIYTADLNREEHDGLPSGR
jgi:RNA polymerase sigma-70 factor (ECF subfamily)